jgi:ribonucleoside-diphosphate reductase alpha chain/ribonucleoside-triphosphate reductase
MRYAKEMRIPAPVLVTCVKPEGTLSQLPTVSSGLHRSYAPYFIRRIRVSDIDPVCKALQAIGVPNEPDKSKPDRIVFSFPIETNAPYKAADEPAIDQLDRYYNFQRNYTDQNTSCTITFAEEEIPELIDAILDNWDDTVAIALLKKDTTAYPQLPYEAVSKEEYLELQSKMPSKDILALLPRIVDKYERGEIGEDELESSCQGGACGIR